MIQHRNGFGARAKREKLESLADSLEGKVGHVRVLARRRRVLDDWVGEGDVGESPRLGADRLVKEDLVHGAREVELHLAEQGRGAVVEAGEGEGDVAL